MPYRKKQNKMTRVEKKQFTRRKIIQATMDAIASEGFSGVTMAKVAERARLSRGIGNFHFKSKEQLLVEVLHSIYFEFDGAWKRAIVEADGSPTAQISAMIETVLRPPIAEKKKLAVWLAYWGEIHSRETYLKICNVHDREWVKAVENILQELVDDDFKSRDMRLSGIAESLTAMMDGFWVNSLIYSDRHTEENAIKACFAFLKSFFPAFRPIRSN